MAILEKLEKYILLAILFLVPVFVLPIFPNPFDTAKLALLVVGIILFLVVKALQIVSRGHLDYSSGKYDIPVLLFIFVYLVAAIFKTPNKMDAFLLPGTATLVIGAGLIYFFLNSLGPKAKKGAEAVLYFSGVAAALVILLAFSGLLAKIPALPAYIRDVNFTSFGGLLPAALYLGLIGVLGLGLTLSEADLVKKVFFGVSLTIVILGLGLAVFNLLPGKATSPTLPPFATSWAVGVETIKVSPLLGIGPGNYLTAFNRYRPVSYNLSRLWAVRFTTAANFPLTALTETGLVGLLAFILVIVIFGKNLKKQIAEGEIFPQIALGLAFILLLAFPASPAVLVLTFALYSLASPLSPRKLNLTTQVVGTEGASDTNKLPAYLIGVPLIVAVLILTYFFYGVTSAEANFKAALAALNRGDGKTTYELLRRSITLNPFVDRYHASYAQVNFALAQAMAQNENLTDEERQTVAQLIQQAIREGKATVTLNPQRAGNWEVLARIYQAIMPFAQGADNFTIQTYTQAVALDPTNPNLRIALGGVYYALGRFDEAQRSFELASIAKPDLANSYYNLAIALREKGEIEAAIAQINIVLTLVEKDSSDYQLAKAELDNLEKRRTTGQAEGSENLTPPPAAEAPLIEPPLTLPEEANPPTTQE